MAVRCSLLARIRLELVPYLTYTRGMPRRIEDFRGLKQPSRIKILHAIQRHPGRKLSQLAAAAGIHINTARDHVAVLEAEGLITSQPAETGTRGRPPLVFHPVSQPAESPQADERVSQAQAQGELLRRLNPDLDYTEVIGPDAQRQVDTLLTHLEDVGLDPTGLNTDSMELALQPCTYHELIAEYGAVVCSMHARLIQDHLSQVPGPLCLVKLRPFVTPHECLLTLGNSSPDEPLHPDADPPVEFSSLPAELASEE